MSNQLWWYTARAGGLVAWGLVTASVLWGLALSTKVFGRRPRPNWLLDLHRFLGGGAIVFTAVHVGSVVADNYVHFGLTEILVPFTGSWHPVAVAWGVVGLYFLVAIEITSLLRKHLSKRAWRATHFLSFPLFVLATTHMVTAGTDRTTTLVRFAAIGALAAVGALTAVRLDRSTDGGEPPRVPNPARRPEPSRWSGELIDTAASR
jgi:DMSO/TMAO reductase YedYZ heme-binding membrane subunit